MRIEIHRIDIEKAKDPREAIIQKIRSCSDDQLKVLEKGINFILLDEEDVKEQEQPKANGNLYSISYAKEIYDFTRSTADNLWAEINFKFNDGENGHTKILFSDYDELENKWKGFCRNRNNVDEESIESIDIRLTDGQLRINNKIEDLFNDFLKFTLAGEDLKSELYDTAKINIMIRTIKAMSTLTSDYLLKDFWDRYFIRIASGNKYYYANITSLYAEHITRSEYKINA